MMSDEKKEILEILLSNRFFLYSLMNKVFGCEPNPELLKILVGEATKEAFGLLSEETDDTMACCVRFLAELHTEYTSPGFLDHAKNEYTRLFIGPDKMAAPPWESVYRNKQGLLFQESTLEVRSFYQKFHMLPEDYPHVADDSLVLELDFMSRLAGKCLEAFRVGNIDSVKYYLNGQNAFLQDHLLIWVPKFLEKMANAPSEYLYPQMCLVLNDFLKRDKKIIEEILNVVKTSEGNKEM